MELNGKTINFMGDSITEAYGASSFECAYHQLMKKIYNLKEVFVDGISGTRIARQKGKTDPESFDRDFVSRVDNLKDFDYTIIFGGTNDYGHGDSLFGSINDNDVYTFYGAYNTLLENIQNKLPNTKIIVLTPLRRLDDNKIVRENGKVLIDYVNAIKEVCNKHNVIYFDLFNALDYINPNNKEINTKYIPDGVHPNDLGHEILAKEIGNFIKSL